VTQDLNFFGEIIAHAHCSVDEKNVESKLKLVKKMKDSECQIILDMKIKEQDFQAYIGNGNERFRGESFMFITNIN
jgi:hypothetical protein